MDEKRQTPRRPGNRERMQQRNTGGRGRNKALIVTGSTILIVALILVLVATTKGLNTNFDQIAEQTPLTAEEQRAEPQLVEISFVAAGDNLIHNTIYEQAAARAGGNGYDFSYAYQEVAPYVTGKDIAFINQETPLACAINAPSNYPMFNTPTESVQALRDVGFNVFNLASNHTYDQGASGMEATIDAMATISDALAVGAYRNEEDLHVVRKLNIKGVDVAFVGITEMTNGISLPSDSPLELILCSETEQAQTAISEAKAAADVVVVSVHWGQENVTEPNEFQRSFGQQLADWGADLIIGHHPHALQPIEILDAGGRQVPVIYSLGNFISAMSNTVNHVGGLLGCTIAVDKASGQVSIHDIEFIPTICYFGGGYTNIRVVPLSSYTAEMSSSHGKGVTIEYANELLNSVIGPAYLGGTPSQEISPEEADTALSDAWPLAG